MKRGTGRTLVRTATAVAAGLAAATVLAACGSPAPARHHAASQNSRYDYYRSMMSRYHGGTMMGSGPGRWMMGAGGYGWMTGARGVPGWMHGGRLPAYMMGRSADPGKIMGRFWANAPGSRVSAVEAAALSRRIPAGAHINRAANTITFTSGRVSFAAVASPRGGQDETFLIAGLVNPKLVVHAGAQVSIDVVNADPDTAHGMVITTSKDTGSWMPMMTARPAFAGSALWFLGDPTSAGMHTGTLTFTASTAGSYRYLCAVPGHARKGMMGAFVVTASH